MVLAGPVLAGYSLRGGTRAVKIVPEGVDFIATGDPEASLDYYLRHGEWREDLRRNYKPLDGVSALGAEIARQHPNFPDVIAEMELSRGCDRADGRCSFCTEGADAAYEERGAEDVASEIRALAALGVSAFRLGRCANILAWGGERTTAGIRPNTERLRELYTAIREAAPSLEVLHTDNCNPLTITLFPEESRACLEVIARLGTEGDGLSLGVECADPDVRARNNLKVSMDEAVRAVAMINDAGGFRKRSRGLPSLLPGLNFVAGLAGETKDSFTWNRVLLETLLEKGLAVRRINIRRAMVFPGSRLEALLADAPSRAKERAYRRWKEWVRDEVDPVMLERVAPSGTLLRGVITEDRSGNIIFGRQLGSYPPLVGIVSPTLASGVRTDVTVTGHGPRSLTGVAHPLSLDACTRTELMAIPGIGKARAERLIAARLYGSDEDLIKALDDPMIAERLKEYFIDLR